MISRLVGQRVRPDVSPDAVVVIPGVMGSTLETGAGVVWGTHKLRWYIKEWTRQESALDQLALTADERSGRYGRVRATGLLRRPAWAPFLQGIEPYDDLVDGIRQVVVHSDAILEFPYDWRLPVSYNANLLEQAAREHLKLWSSHPEYERYRRELPDARPAQLVLVAHSMGGLLIRSLADDLNIRATVTLGTPFDGAAKVAMILNTGRGTPIPFPREKLKAMARTLPGLHDLLPTYRCLDDTDQDTDPVRLTPADVETLGGDPELALASFEWHDQVAARPLPGHRALVGINQPTVSTVTLRGGVLEDHPYTFEPIIGGFARDRHGVLVRALKHGDGTVPDNSARGETVDGPTLLAQQHGPIAKSVESIDFVCAVLCERDVHAPRLGEGELSLDLPDLVGVGREFAVRVGGVSGPTDATVIVRDEDGLVIDYPGLHWADDGYQALVGPLDQGIYQVEVSGGGTSAVSQRVMVTAA